jgi:PAS domain S-box-containing protein
MVPHIAVILTNKERKILWVNQDFVEMTGYALDEVIGRSPGQILQGPGSEREAINRIRKGLENKVPLKEQIINYRKNGEPYICKLVIHPIFGKEQELTHFIAFEVDGDIIDNEEAMPLMGLSQKYSSSSLKGVEEVKLYFKLKDLLQKEKLYLDPNLSLKNVADRLATNTKYLSQVVNNHSGKNFQYFINSYRVSEAKKQIMDSDNNNLTLYGIALQCGFKNKSTFYKVFKEITGQTPREFQKQNGLI